MGSILTNVETVYGSLFKFLVEYSNDAVYDYRQTDGYQNSENNLYARWGDYGMPHGVERGKTNMLETLCYAGFEHGIIYEIESTGSKDIQTSLEDCKQVGLDQSNSWFFGPILFITDASLAMQFRLVSRIPNEYISVNELIRANEPQGDRNV